MPKTTKEISEKEPEKKSNTTKSVAKKVSKTEKKSSTKKVSKTTQKKTTSTSKATTSNKSTKKKQTTKSKSTSTKKTTRKKTNTPVSIIEYYDLPYRYNQTIVEILAQTPQMLFVYWDISDEDRHMFVNKYGNDFFSKTRPILIVHNETKNTTFEIEINDFANSWYLQVSDANCKYQIELGRRPNSFNESIKEDYIYITSSNEIDAPNDHILFEKFNPNVTYKNVKTGNFSTKDFSSLSNYKNMKQIYHIYDLYKDIYKNELFEGILHNDLNNPSSGATSKFM